MRTPAWLIAVKNLVGAGLLAFGLLFTAAGLLSILGGGCLVLFAPLPAGLALTAIGLLLGWPGSRVAHQWAGGCFLGCVLVSAFLWWGGELPLWGLAGAALVGGAGWARLLSHPPGPSAIT